MPHTYHLTGVYRKRHLRRLRTTQDKHVIKMEQILLALENDYIRPCDVSSAQNAVKAMLEGDCDCEMVFADLGELRTDDSLFLNHYEHMHANPFHNGGSHSMLFALRHNQSRQQNPRAVCFTERLECFGGMSSGQA
jgi:hypothetical protein